MHLTHLCIFLTLGLLSLSCKTTDESSRPPNVVIIFTDDLGYNDIAPFWNSRSPAGAPCIDTPHLSRMAREGRRFSHFYVAASVCSPSRAALLTGCYPRRLGLGAMQRDVFFPNSKDGLNPEEITIAEVLKAKGYATACIGKWHLGHLPDYLPTNQGFDVFEGVPYSNDMKPFVYYKNNQVVETSIDQSTLTQRYTRAALKFIQDNQAKPFFLYLPHTFPHTPLHSSSPWQGSSSRGLYGDVVRELDNSVGQILNCLKDLNIDQHTLVVFTSDNGPWLVRGKDGGNAFPLRAGKHTTREGGLRVPCLMWWPGTIPAGSTSEALTTSMDLLPTVAQLSGAPLPQQPIDGKSLVDVMTGTSDQSPHEAFYYYKSPGTLEGVRSGKWKLMLPRSNHADIPYQFKRAKRKRKLDTLPPRQEFPEALYNLVDDPGETTNLIEQHPEVRDRLRALIDKARQELGDNATRTTGAQERSMTGLITGH